jgi:hypothetical protein
MNNLINWIKNKMQEYNQAGVPIILIKDNATGKGSVSLTLLFISSIYVQVSLLNKYTGTGKGVDPANAFEWFLATSGLYFGRSLSKKVQSIPEQNKPEDK